MKNFKITAKEDNKEYWISRSIAVMTVVFASVNGKVCVLANKRGSGTPDYQGYWNCPCGYLDWDESTIDAAKREVYEETGYRIHDIMLHNINDNPCSDDRQNVVFRYFSILKDVISPDPINGEENEVSEVKWIPINEIDDYDWAFNHNIIVREISIRCFP